MGTLDLLHEAAPQGKLGCGAQLFGELETCLLQLLEHPLMALVHAAVLVDEVAHDVAKDQLGDALSPVGQDALEPPFVGAQLLLQDAQHLGERRRPESCPHAGGLRFELLFAWVFTHRAIEVDAAEVQRSHRVLVLLSGGRLLDRRGAM